MGCEASLIDTEADDSANKKAPREREATIIMVCEVWWGRSK